MHPENLVETVVSGDFSSSHFYFTFIDAGAFLVFSPFCFASSLIENVIRQALSLVPKFDHLDLGEGALLIIAWDFSLFAMKPQVQYLFVDFF